MTNPMLQPKEKAPVDVTVKDSQGQPTTLKNYLGKYTVVYFYPKDDTPGCTKEACSFRDWNEEIKKLGVAVVGISKDSPASHVRFAKKYHLNFDLLSDENHELIEAFGAWQQKSFMGRKYMGIVRSTFVLDPKGKVVKVWEKVTPLNHGKEVLEFLKSAL